MKLRWIVAVIALALCACSSSVVPTPSPDAPCQAAGLKEARLGDANARLVAAFVSSVADVASWRSHGYGVADFTGFTTNVNSGKPLDRVDVCYYEGAFTLGSHPFIAAGGTFPPPYDLLLVTVDASGLASIATAGFRGTMPLASPPHGP